MSLKFPGKSKKNIIQKYMIQTIVTDITTYKNVNDDTFFLFVVIVINLLCFLIYTKRK